MTAPHYVIQKEHDPPSIKAAYKRSDFRASQLYDDRQLTRFHLASAQHLFTAHLNTVDISFLWRTLNGVMYRAAKHVGIKPTMCF